VFLIAAASNAGVAKPPKSVLLKGFVEHSEHLKPVPNSLQLGNTLDPKLFEEHTGNSLAWAKIPRWAAGKWLQTATTFVSSYDFRRKVKRTDHRTITGIAEGYLGTQIDDGGNIWQALRSGACSTIKGVDTLTLERVRSWEIVESTDKKMTERRVIETIVVDRHSKRIRGYARSEIIATRHPLQDGMLQQDTSRRDYDMAGNPASDTESWHIETRTKTFEPQGGPAMRAEFLKFLQAQRLR
jgi:hypothetical protein